MDDYTDLLMHLVGRPEDYDVEEAELEFYDRYDIGWHDAIPLIRDLMPLALCAVSPLTQTAYQGFGKDGLWLAKRPMEDAQ